MDKFIKIAYSTFNTSCIDRITWFPSMDKDGFFDCTIYGKEPKSEWEFRYVSEETKLAIEKVLTGKAVSHIGFKSFSGNDVVLLIHELRAWKNNSGFFVNDSSDTDSPWQVTEETYNKILSAINDSTLRIES